MTEKHEPLRPDDVIPGDPATTLWRLCATNGWAFVPDFAGGEPFVDTQCAAYLLSIKEKTLQNHYLDGVPKYGNGLVKLSEVMQRRTTNDN
jgi:hypothetical protein